MTVMPMYILLARTLVDKEHCVPDEKAACGWDDVDAQGTVAGVDERGVFEGDGGAGEDAFIGGSSGPFA